MTDDRDPHEGAGADTGASAGGPEPRATFDDDLASALRSEVPSPGPGYWDRIDAMLDRVADRDDDVDGDTVDGDSAPAAGTGDGSEDSVPDTGPTVIRLTAMNDIENRTTRSSDSRSRRRTTLAGTSLLSRAAMLIVLLGAVGAAMWVGTRGDDSSPGRTEVAGPGVDDTDEPSDPATTPDDDGDPDDPTPTPGDDDQIGVAPSRDPRHEDCAAGDDAACEELGQFAPSQLPAWVGSLTMDTIADAGVEAIGCWFRLEQDFGSDVVFFGGFDGGFMVLLDELVELNPLPEATPIDMWTVTDYADLTGGEPRWTVTFTGVGEPVETSIESKDWTATLTVTAADGTTWSTDGVLGCGV